MIKCIFYINIIVFKRFIKNINYFSIKNEFFYT